MSEKWDKRFLELAKHISTWSKDPSTKVGAVIVDPLNRIVSTGYNGFPKGVSDSEERLNNKEIKYNYVIHGEISAILFAKADLKGCTLYCYPLPSCCRCATQIIQTGISRVVSPACKNDRWVSSCNQGKEIMQEAGIIVDEVEID